MATEPFQFHDGILYAEGVDLRTLADSFGTPTYVYSSRRIEENYQRLVRAFEPLRPHIAYAAKANGNQEILRLLIGLGAGIDVVSGGELERAFLAGAQMERVTFAGTGKTEAEIRAALEPGCSPLAGCAGVDQTRLSQRGRIGHFNVESEGELERIANVAEELGTRAVCCLRVNPNVDARTHKYTTTGKKENKFGLDVRLAPRIFEAWRGNRSLALVGLHFHLGSPIATPSPYAEALDVVMRMIDELQKAGHEVSVLNIGGGFGIAYGHEPQSVSTPEEFAAAIVPVLHSRVEQGLRVHLEPGRVLVGDAGILVTRVQYLKESGAKTFAICDAGMHTLIRPALYGAYHFVWPVAPSSGFVPQGKRPLQNLPGLRSTDLVGPICESSDFLAQERQIPPLRVGDLVAVFDSGAYGMSMASTYNDQPLPAEVLVRARGMELITPRQSVADLLGVARTARGG